MSNSNNGSVHIFGCGGTGINLASAWSNAVDNNNSAVISTTFADTSHSNITASMEKDDCFIIPNVDGSGKVRKENHAKISENLAGIILKHPPKDVNIVVFSASGGSGSVIGPLLASELVKRGHTTICLVVGSTESIISTRNTRQTIASLDSLSDLIEKPILMRFFNNRDNSRREDVDRAVFGTIRLINILAHKGHHGFDSTDLANWACYDKVTDVAPQLTFLEITSDLDEANAIPYPITIASLYTRTPEVTISGADYQTEGYFAKGTEVEGVDEIHYVTFVSGLTDLVDSLDQELDKLSEKRNARPTNRIQRRDDSETVNGMIL